MVFKESLAIPIPGHIQGFFHCLQWTASLPRPLTPSEAWRNTTHPTRPGSNIILFELLLDAALVGDLLSPQCSHSSGCRLVTERETYWHLVLPLLLRLVWEFLDDQDEAVSFSPIPV